MSEPALSLVCSTIGRPDALRQLLDSVAASDIADRVEFVLIDQSTDQQSTQILDEYPLPGRKVATTSRRGLSIGRNAGVALTTSPILAFPDDNCFYPPTTLGNALDFLERHPEYAGLSGMQLSQDGTPSMLRWLTASTDVNRRNFARTTISSTLFFRRDVLPSLAPFDEGLGVGAPGWRGAGEESDLLLRLLASGHRLRYVPDIHVRQDDDRSAITEEYVGKMLKYGVGTGHLWRRHRLSLTQLGYYSARKLAGSSVRAVRGDRIHARADMAYLRGQIAGFRGVAPRSSLNRP